jgi:uncharacterized membrane protein YuzA (DUF378 family)
MGKIEVNMNIKTKVFQRHLTNDEQAFHPVILGIVTFTVVAILFGILVMVYAEIQPSIVGSDDISNNTIEKMNSNVYTGFNLGSVTPVLLGATLIISIIIGMVGVMFTFQE